MTEDYGRPTASDESRIAQEGADARVANTARNKLTGMRDWYRHSEGAWSDESESPGVHPRAECLTAAQICGRVANGLEAILSDLDAATRDAEAQGQTSDAGEPKATDKPCSTCGGAGGHAGYYADDLPRACPDCEGTGLAAPPTPTVEGPRRWVAKHTDQHVVHPEPWSPPNFVVQSHEAANDLAALLNRLEAAANPSPSAPLGEGQTNEMA